MAPGPSVHANALVVGETGILIRGPAGAGKTTTSLALISHFAAAGRFAALVADDRVVLAVHHGRLIARAPDSISGLVELRGQGVVPVAYEPACVLRLVVDLVPAPEPARMPAESERSVRILDVSLPRIAVQAGPGTLALLLAGLHALEATGAVPGRLAFAPQHDEDVPLSWRSRLDPASEPRR